jgi:hypothetical protein
MKLAFFCYELIEPLRLQSSFSNDQECMWLIHVCISRDGVSFKVNISRIPVMSTCNFSSDLKQHTEQCKKSDMYIQMYMSGF